MAEVKHVRRSHSLLWFIIPAGASLGILATGFSRGTGTEEAQTYGDIAILLAALTAFVSHTRAAIQARENRVARWFMAAGLLVWASAQGLWTYYGVTLDHAYPFPSFADLGFTGYSIPVGVALLLLARRSGPRLPFVRSLLDIGVVASAVLFMAWGSVLGPVASDQDDDPLSHIAQLAYPIVDVMMLSLVIILTMRAARGHRLPWLCLSVGFLVLALTDIIYVRLTFDGVTGTTGSPLAVGWVLAFLLVGFSPLLPESEETTKDGRAYTAALELLPYLPVFMAPFFSRSRPLTLSDPVLVFTGLTVLVFVIVRQVLIVVENVTLTRNLESKVAERTAQLEDLGAIVNSSGDAIVGKTAEGVITSWNPSAERIYGYPASEAIGRNSDFFIPEHLLAIEHAILSDAAKDGKVHIYETERVRGDGNSVAVAVTMSPIRGQDGIRGVATIAQDITERKAAEAELLAAREAALESSRLKSEFLATMSHEIRTPLNAVIGLTSLLMDTRLSEAQRQYAEGVKGAGEVLLALINDILDFSKLEAGKVELDIAAFDPRLLVEEVAGLVAEAAQAKDLELISYCHTNVPARLLGDVVRIRQILLNLSSNAVKFTPSGEVEIHVKMLSQRDDKAVLRFEVRDTGIGIGAGDHQRMFESFAQADASTTRRYGGTGLGLAISRRLTQAMGGEIGLSSEVGQGSTFWFVLELPIGQAVEDDAEPIPDLLTGLNVLVVDDNATNRLVLESQLAGWGMRPVAVPDARSAVEKVHQASAAGTPYDIAVVDMCMPETDGLQLARQIKAEEDTPPRFILLTSTMEVDKAGLAQAGIREHLTKPVRSSEFYNRLLRLMAVKLPAAREPARQGAAPKPARSLGRLLVAEDNEVNQLVAQGMAARLGYDVDIVTDGAQAVAATAATRYAAVLMDCHMPVMDGFEATRTIRGRNGEAGRIPIIAMTAGAMDEDRERCLAAGMDDYISKPVDLTKLGNVLSRWVRQSDAGAQTEGPTTSSDAGAQSGSPTTSGAAGAQSGSPTTAGAAAELPPEATTPGLPAPTELSPSSSGPALDADRLAVLRELGPGDGLGLLPGAARAFRDEVQRSVSTLRLALEGGDADAVRQTAHRLAGAASNIGAMGAAELSKELERMGRDAGAEGSEPGVALALTGSSDAAPAIPEEVPSEEIPTTTAAPSDDASPFVGGLELLARLEAELAEAEAELERLLSESGWESGSS
ncbi:response regulator [Arthrobacter sp. M4]|uniref:hybrid sensor histidine kinase/response regulator n=1 Tax=Arthrobacter sp. M4 TaxID=218160 RepID=UPI001CDB5691|nr:response regulator [Arthrobacter sp. M4]MCA4133098.1 response regulator [Arthrobacter sp. M4]